MKLRELVTESKEEVLENLMQSQEFHEAWRSSHTPWKRIKKIKRNDPCPCGSGKKWKKCDCEEYHNDAVIGWVV